MGSDQLRRMTSEDIYRFKLINEPQFSPDGERISYVVTTIARPFMSQKPTVRDRAASPRRTPKILRRAGRRTASTSPSCPTATRSRRFG
jgi:hypothetical protein